MSFEKPDIVNVLENECIELKQKGKYLWGLCPVHPERYPSFKVDPQRQRFYCFGCGTGGDVITFIQKVKGLSFKEALIYLGINGSKPSKKNFYETLRIKRKRELTKQYQQWCAEYYDDLCSLIRCLWKAKQRVRDIEQAEALSQYYQLEPLWLHYIEILQGNDDKQKLSLYREAVYGS